MAVHLKSTGAHSCQLAIKVVPQAKRLGLVGTHGAALKIALTAPPVDGAANAQLCDYLAIICGLRAAQITVQRGQLSPHKIVAIDGLSAADFCSKLTALIPELDLTHD